MKKPILDVKQLTIALSCKRGLKEIVKGISFTINPGEIVGLIGPSGCGKSLTAAALLGLLPNTFFVRGSIEFEGTNLLQCSQRELERMRGCRLGLILQDPNLSLNPILTIGRQLTEGIISCRGVAPDVAFQRGIEWLFRVGITEPALRMRQYPHELSGGMKQRLLIAIALISQPSLVIADEPTTALDVVTQVEILRLLIQLQQEEGMALLFISHDLSVIAHTCQKAIVMDGGEIVEAGSVKELFASPQHSTTKSLVEAENKAAQWQRRAPCHSCS